MANSEYDTSSMATSVSQDVKAGAAYYKELMNYEQAGKEWLKWYLQHRKYRTKKWRLLTSAQVTCLNEIAGSGKREANPGEVEFLECLRGSYFMPPQPRDYMPPAWHAKFADDESKYREEVELCANWAAIQDYVESQSDYEVYIPIPQPPNPVTKPLAVWRVMDKDFAKVESYRVAMEQWRERVKHELFGASWSTLSRQQQLLVLELANGDRYGQRNNDLDYPIANRHAEGLQGTDWMPPRLRDYMKGNRSKDFDELYFEQAEEELYEKYLRLPIRGESEDHDEDAVDDDEAEAVEQIEPAPKKRKREEPAPSVQQRPTKAATGAKKGRKPRAMTAEQAIANAKKDHPEKSKKVVDFHQLDRGDKPNITIAEVIKVGKLVKMNRRHTALPWYFTSKGLLRGLSEGKQRSDPVKEILTAKDANGNLYFPTKDTAKGWYEFNGAQRTFEDLFKDIDPEVQTIKGAPRRRKRSAMTTATNSSGRFVSAGLADQGLAGTGENRVDKIAQKTVPGLELNSNSADEERDRMLAKEAAAGAHGETELRKLRLIVQVKDEELQSQAAEIRRLKATIDKLLNL